MTTDGPSAEQASGAERLRAAIAQLPHDKLSHEQYQRMVAAGILDEDAPVELIQGELIAKAPMGSGHVAAVNRHNKTLTIRLGERALVSPRSPIRLPSRSEPEPDIAVLRPRADFYASGLPETNDVLLLVEVADSRYESDTAAKLLLYAQAGIAEVWIHDIAGEQLEAHTEPTPDGYRLRRVYRRGETITPLAFPEVALALDQLLSVADASATPTAD